MIEVQNLSKIFHKGKSNEVKACDDISIKLESPGFYVIYGKSGAGKSSLMNALGGLDKYSSGQIIFGDKPFKHEVKDAFRIANIGYIFQNYCLDENLNVYDNVALGLKSMGIKDEELIFNRVMTALANVRMSKYFRRNVGTLSGGQQQRVAIARAIVKGSKIILADEPTGNLDEENTIHIMSILKEISKTRIVIVVTHEVNIVEAYADKIIEIFDGRVIKESNGSAQVYEHKDKNKIFLSELEKKEIDLGNITIEQYGKDIPINIKLINDDGKFYLKSDNAKLKILDDKSEVKLIEETREEYKEMMQEDVDLQLKDLEPIEVKSGGRVFRYKDCIPKKKKVGNNKLRKRNNLLKISLGLMVGILILLSAFWGSFYNQKELNSNYRLGNQISVSYLSENDFNKIQKLLRDNQSNIKSSLNIERPNISRIWTDSGEMSIINSGGVKLINSTFESQVDPKDKNLSVHIPVNFASIGDLSSYNIFPPIKDGEVIISTGVLYSHIEGIKANINPHYKGNINDMKERIIGSYLEPSQGMFGGGNSNNKTYRIVGLVEDQDAYVYATLNDLIDFTTFDSQHEFEILPKGSVKNMILMDSPEQAKDVVLEDNVVYIYELPGEEYKEKVFSITVNRREVDLKYKFIKFAEEPEDIYNVPLIMNEETANRFASYIPVTMNFIRNKNSYNNNTGFIINVPNNYAYRVIENSLKSMSSDSDGITVYANSNMQQKVNVIYIEESLKSLGITLLVLYLFIIAISIFIMFINFTDKTKEIGIYRAIGVSKKNCVYKYFVESFRTVISYVCMIILILGGILSLISYFPISEDIALLNGSLFFLSWWQLLAIVIAIIPVLMLISILPPLKYVRKSPIKILSEYDM